MKKHSANWYIAATHYLTAGFVIPLLVMFIFGIVLGFLSVLPTVILTLLYAGIMALAIWLATSYSANFLKKQYIIKDKDKIVNLSTIYLIVLGTINLVLQFSVLSIILLAVMAVVFYLGSKRYIEETPEVSEQ
jgi:hypothetical protein